MSTIYWKFKNTKQEFSSVTFDSTHVSILDLKRAIIKQKKLQQTPNQPFDLSIINAHTGVEYTDETGPIPRNLAVIVRRLPAAKNQHRKLWAPLQNNSIIATAESVSQKTMQTISERLHHEFGPNIFNNNQNSSGSANNASLAEVKQVESETMSIVDMMNRRVNNGTTTTTTTSGHSGMRNNRNHMNMKQNNNNMNGGNNGNNKDGKRSYQSQRGDPPPGYICHRCHVSGHWIQDCPTNGDPNYDKKNRQNTLRSKLPGHELAVPKPATPTNVSGDTNTNIPTQQVIIGKKCYQIPTNVYESFNGDHSKIKAYIALQSDTNSFAQQTSNQATRNDSKFHCEICHNYFVDARYTPCCHNNYCNECIRQKSLPSNPSLIKCPCCEDLFSSEALDTAKNENLQKRVDKIVAKQQKDLSATAMPSDISSAINLNPSSTATNPNNPSPPTITNNTNTTNTPQTIQIPHPTSNIQHQTIHIPQPVITRTPVRPTVILQQSPPMRHQSNITNIIPPPIPVQPAVNQIDSTRFEPPKPTFVTGDGAHYTCIECGQQGHKYKDCPKVAEKKEIVTKREDEIAASSSSSSDAESNIDGLTVSVDISNPIQSDIKQEQKLTDLEPLDRIPKKTPAEMAGITNNNGHNANNNGNIQQPSQQPLVSNHNNGNNSEINAVKPMMNTNLNQFHHAQQRVTPQVQLINNSALSSLNALNSLNMMNMRNRLTVNNILMNAALHNATRRGGIAPTLINSHNNPLLNSALALSRLPNTPHTTNPLALLQQQSLLSQQAAFNRLRNTPTPTPPSNPLLASTINNNINLNTANINLGATNNINPIISNLPNPSATITNTNQSKFNLANIPPELLQSTIKDLQQIMSSGNQQQAITDAINAAFIKLGATDPDSKRLVLEQLVNACSNNKNIADNSQQNGEKEQSKKSKKKRSKSKSKRSKKKKKDKDRKSSKDRKHRHRKKKDREEDRDRKKRRKDKDRERSRETRSKSRHQDSENEHDSENEANIELSVSVEPQENLNTNPSQHLDINHNNNQQSGSSGTDFPDPEEEENIIHVNVVNEKKRKLPPAPIPDFNVETPPPQKRQRLSNQTSPNSVSASPTPPNKHK